MEKFYEAICWIAFGILVLFAVVVILMRSFAFVAIVVLFIRSALPWWVLAPAGILLVSGFVYLFSARRRRIPQNKKFLN
jgi:hypothetical protein